MRRGLFALEAALAVVLVALLLIPIVGPIL